MTTPAAAGHVSGRQSGNRRFPRPPKPMSVGATTPGDGSGPSGGRWVKTNVVPSHVRYKCAVTIALESLIAKAQKDGWASASGSIGLVQVSAGLLGLAEVPIRRGDPALATLRPIEQSDAPTRSLSARYGTGNQPLHTDGAHLEQPPDLVFLMCEGTSTTPTRLWRPRRRDNERLVMEPEYVRHGIFLVHNGKNSFFSPAVADARFRYDPGCMTPCDARARQAAEYFEQALELATEHQWDEPNSILVIDNRRALHARASAAEEPEREVQRIAYRLKGEA